MSFLDHFSRPIGMDLFMVVQTRRSKLHRESTLKIFHGSMNRGVSRPESLPCGLPQISLQAGQGGNVLGSQR